MSRLVQHSARGLPRWAAHVGGSAVFQSEGPTHPVGGSGSHTCRCATRSWTAAAAPAGKTSPGWRMPRSWCMRSLYGPCRTRCCSRWGARRAPSNPLLCSIRSSHATGTHCGHRNGTLQGLTAVTGMARYRDSLRSQEWHGRLCRHCCSAPLACLFWHVCRTLCWILVLVCYTLLMHMHACTCTCALAMQGARAPPKGLLLFGPPGACVHPAGNAESAGQVQKVADMLLCGLWHQSRRCGPDAFGTQRLLLAQIFHSSEQGSSPWGYAGTSSEQGCAGTSSEQGSSPWGCAGTSSERSVTKQ